MPDAAGTTTAGNLQGNYVTFGNSLSANPGFKDEPNGIATIAAGGYETSTENFRHRVAEKTNLDHHEDVCTGSVVYLPENDSKKRMLDQVDSTDANKHLEENSELVTVLIGANDAVRMS